MTDSIKVSGLKEANRALYSYSQQLGDRVVIASLRQGANLTLKQVRKNAPLYKGKPRKGVVSGALRKGFGVRKSKIHKGRRSGELIGVFLTLKKKKKVGPGRNPLDPFYGKFINYGWRRGSREIPGLFFVERAFRSTKTRAVNTIVRAVEIGADIVKRKVGLR